ncbi:MAG: preprotein translocase subunit SecE [Lachnospiraceae bacterium]|uniref:Preprotein translocase subunit SecE n=1 Tax=Candidatus Weimeria bifida TaxID=2599074 RepID=A0A6N7J2H5_9FIRM|nr:preprotein translocase subunit SecE [Candidatus Weimeria bifida]RRF97371.1 MAG: preprotein translocase subunit SecE [Lachnospiraceae bacterium]
MAETKKKRKRISEWWDGVKAEFGKIVWADRKTVGRQTVAVVIISVVLALLIVFFDMIIRYGLDKLIKL